MADTTARTEVRALAASKIREVANAGMGREGLLPFWFGEPDTVTPEAIRQAGIASIQAGETFYSQNLGIPVLREALAAYVSRLHAPVGAARIAVTNSGMSALMLAEQSLLSPGDKVVVVAPVWPNLTEGPRVLGAEVHTVALDFGPQGWQLDLDKLLDALDWRTRMVIVNSPNNPTGWTMPRAQQRALLEHCRSNGIWILADEAYERLYFDGVPGHAVAPAFLDLAQADDRLVTVNTFSKAWQMTGWRLGWITAPEALVEDIGKLIEFNTCCAPTFVQKAGLAAVEGGEAVVAAFVARLRASRDFLIPRLNALPGVQAAPPPGAMYAFFRVDGMDDSLAFCKRLAADFGLGLAPGAGFGREGEHYLRWCFAAEPLRLQEGLARLGKALAALRP